MSQLRYEYDREADAIYVYLSEKPYAFGEDIRKERRIDYAADRTPVGIELTCVSEGVDLADLPARDALAELLTELHIKLYA